MPNSSSIIAKVHLLKSFGIHLVTSSYLLFEEAYLGVFCDTASLLEIAEGEACCCL